MYLRPFPNGDRKLRISIGGGDGPQWRDDGKELFYVDQRATLMAVDINAGATVGAGVPNALFQTRMIARSGGILGFPYAVGANGQRFLISEPADASRQSGSAPIIVVTNWVASVKR